MTCLDIYITIEYKRNRTWGANPRATVTAELYDVREDMTTGKASGCGYDKPSAAVCNAFRENPLLQTLLLWDGWKANTVQYGPDVIREQEWHFAGMGVESLLDHLRANKFVAYDVYDDNGRLTGVVAWRDMPKSFVSLV